MSGRHGSVGLAPTKTHIPPDWRIRKCLTHFSDIVYSMAYVVEFEDGDEDEIGPDDEEEAMIRDRNDRNFGIGRGFVKMSATLSSEAILTSCMLPLATSSLMN